jgi:hypothetical protein
VRRLSPVAKKGCVDRASDDATSILEFIALCAKLAPLPGVCAGNLAGALDLL